MEYLAGGDYQTKGILVHPSLTPNPHKSGHKEVDFDRMVAKLNDLAFSQWKILYDQMVLYHPIHLSQSLKYL